MTWPFLDWDGPIPVAHRGGAAEQPENTMAAFSAAVALGYRYVETDVHATADGVLLAFHDHTLDRVTDRTGRSRRLPVRLRPRGAGGHRAHSPAGGRPRRVAGPPRPHRRQASRRRRPLGGRHRQDRRPRPGLHRLVLGPHRPCAAPAGRRADLHVDGPRRDLRAYDWPAWACPFPARWPGAPRSRCARAGCRSSTGASSTPPAAGSVGVHVWTINERPEMERLLDLGVDAVLSDRPTVLKQVLVDRGLWIDG